METKGYKSTEFWMSFAAIILSGLMASGLFAEEGTMATVLGMAATVMTTLGYTVSRTLFKRKKLELEAAGVAE